MVYRLFLTQGRPMSVDFAPEIPDGMSIVKAAVDGREFHCPVSRRRGLLAVPVCVVVRDSTEIRFEYAGGVGIVPPVTHPEPGDSSAAFRFMGASLDGRDYRIDVEGTGGTTGTIRLLALDQRILSVAGGSFHGEDQAGVQEISIAFGPSPAGRVSGHVVVTLGESPR